MEEQTKQRPKEQQRSTKHYTKN